jgi:predicted MFS family arabinose efflux permease
MRPKHHVSGRDGRSASSRRERMTGNLIGRLVGGVLPNLIGIRNTFFAGGAVISIAMFATIFLVKEDHLMAGK